MRGEALPTFGGVLESIGFELDVPEHPPAPGAAYYRMIDAGEYRATVVREGGRELLVAAVRVGEEPTFRFLGCWEQVEIAAAELPRLIRLCRVQ